MTAEPQFFPSNYPAQLATSAAGSKSAYRIAVEGALIIGMGLPGAPLTVGLAFASRDVAESYLTEVQKTIPAAEIVLVNEGDCGSCADIFSATEGGHGCEAHYPPAAPVVAEEAENDATK